MLTLTFEITLLSNYHSGAGYGKGFGLDSALLREADGALVLRGSGLAGLFRDSVYRLLKLKPLRQHDADEVQERLFGSPAQPKRWHFSSARPVERQSADAQIVQRVRIDPRTRRAEPRKLFSQEEGNAGQVFRFTITCAATDEAALDDAALLVAAARYIRQLGRSRRRGLGECVIHLTEVSGMKQISPDSWEAWFLERFERA
jgi:CRISPR-associated protein Csx10